MLSLQRDKRLECASSVIVLNNFKTPIIGCVDVADLANSTCSIPKVSAFLSTCLQEERALVLLDLPPYSEADTASVAKKFTIRERWGLRVSSGELITFFELGSLESVGFV